MFGLRQTVSLLLFGFGALLVGLGAMSLLMSLFMEPPEGAPPEAVRVATTIFTIGGVLGVGLIAWSIYLRSHKSQGDSWPLWVTYIVLLGPLVALAVFLGDEFVETAWTRPSASQSRGTVKGIIALLFILLGPLILLFRHKSPGTSRPADGQPQKIQPGVAAPGNWRFRPVGSLVCLAIIGGMYGLAIWVEQYLPGSISVAGLVFGLLVFAVGVFPPLRNLVFYPPPRPPSHPVDPGKQPPPKAEPDAADPGMIVKPQDIRAEADAVDGRKGSS
jgi:hypothetical protein